MRPETLWAQGHFPDGALKAEMVSNRADGVAGHADELVGFAVFSLFCAFWCLALSKLGGATDSGDERSACALQQRFI